MSGAPPARSGDIQSQILDMKRKQNALRKCPFCDANAASRPGNWSSKTAFDEHLKTNHTKLIAEKSDLERTEFLDECWQKMNDRHNTSTEERTGGASLKDSQPGPAPTSHPIPPSPSSKNAPAVTADQPDRSSADATGHTHQQQTEGKQQQQSQQQDRRPKSRTADPDAQNNPKRSAAVQSRPHDFPGPKRGKGGELYDPNDPGRSSHGRKQQGPTRAREPGGSGPGPGGGGSSSRTQSWLDNQPAAGDLDIPETEILIKQPETRPISQEQLVAEVKGIYAGLVMVESKCIEVDNAQSSNKDATHNKLNNEQWQALIALHRTLLHEHHDFFLASQHPSASPALRRLASKYAMPARMWRHGIHSFLELLRHRLPASLEHMLTFIYLAYSMMALLYETVPAFEDTWIECLGDLGRYRMAIEDDDIRDREIWTSVSRHWYSKASDKAPMTGRLYHHLAILARPNALQQLFYYAKSLCVPVPFHSAKESIMTLFEPILSGQQLRLQPVDNAYVRAHGIMFCGKQPEHFGKSVDEFISLLDNHIGRTTKRWVESGYFISISLACSLVEYGDETNPLVRATRLRPEEGMGAATIADTHMDGANVEATSPSKRFQDALYLTVRTHEVVFRRFGDPNILPYLHSTLAFMLHLSAYPTAMAHLEQFPWKLVSFMLNTLLDSYTTYDRIEGDAPFPCPNGAGVTPRPLPEDFAMRGLLWVEEYYPTTWFSGERVDDDEKYFEMPSMEEERKERVLWIGCRLAARNKWLLYDSTAHQFTVTELWDVEMSADLLMGPHDEAHDDMLLDESMRTPKQRAETTGGDLDIPDAPAILT